MGTLGIPHGHLGNPAQSLFDRTEISLLYKMRRDACNLPHPSGRGKQGERQGHSDPPFSSQRDLQSHLSPLSDSHPTMVPGTEGEEGAINARAPA